MGWSRRTAFVGREDELALFDDAAAAARSGTPQIVLVEGEAGIGKTRLVAEAIARSQQEHDVVVACHGVALTGDQLAFGGVVELVRNVAAARPRRTRTRYARWRAATARGMGRARQRLRRHGSTGSRCSKGFWVSSSTSVVLTWSGSRSTTSSGWTRRRATCSCTPLGHCQDAQLMITCTVRTTELPTIWRGPAAGLRAQT